MATGEYAERYASDRATNATEQDTEHLLPLLDESKRREERLAAGLELVEGSRWWRFGRALLRLN